MFSIGLSSALKSTALMAAFGVATLASSVAWADNFMDAQWANQVCAKWNQNTTLTTELGDWANNNGGKGYKALQMYRDGCGGATKVELDIAPKEGKAVCVYSGAVKTTKLNSDVDYLMHATDADWSCMGKGSWGCGAMGAMMSGKLQFEGPKMEAANVMGPFGEFLLLTGAVPSNMNTCPGGAKVASAD
ncbi:MAG: sterol-binding protein [Halothiobacillus sp. 24-54-40]|jgi:putative sterol carrier protein|nr:MAG: sterol-binding protein [Halothiobacillus sp. 20-53-49]OYY31480.1 MAG: sterol-binding protein [Halothiobacillus sp. 35-54-62]OYZ85547.1 MAG: sterol-binding protein [Halothiobacillus sp. 24-54-40]OZA79099.1 MAG: sterol-binding protein [Halothiobacillus sp. 39-53-45]HQS03606.1 SCP2 sterol-binding domain-containing protein [Halothiobacillus sp.]